MSLLLLSSVFRHAQVVEAIATIIFNSSLQQIKCDDKQKNDGRVIVLT